MIHNSIVMFSTGAILLITAPFSYRYFSSGNYELTQYFVYLCFLILLIGLSFIIVSLLKSPKYIIIPFALLLFFLFTYEYSRTNTLIRMVPSPNTVIHKYGWPYVSREVSFNYANRAINSSTEHFIKINCLKNIFVFVLIGMAIVFAHSIFKKFTKANNRFHSDASR